MIYLQNRRYLSHDSPLRKLKRGFPYQGAELQEPPLKRNYATVREYQQAAESAQLRFVQHEYICVAT